MQSFLAVETERSLLLLLNDGLLSTSDETGSSGGDETTLLSSGGISSHGSGVTNVLMVTTTMRMLDGVHSDTSNSGPVLLLCLGFVVSVDGSQERLITPLSTGDNTNHSSAGSLDGFTNTGRKLDSGLAAIFGVTDDDTGGSGSTGEGTSVSEFGLNVGNNSAFGHGVDGKDVSNLEGGFLSSIDEHTSVHALDGDEVFSSELVLVHVSELNLSERGSTTGIVDNILDDSLDVALSLSEIKCSELGGCHSLVCVSSEDSAASVSLSSDASSHD
jgi:hypothetical protein